MKKKTRIITSIDPAHNGDKSIITTAAIKSDGSVHILRMEEVPTPIFTPKPIVWYERLESFKNILRNGELKFSQSAIESLKEWPKPHYVAPLNPKQRPPSAHKRIYKPGRKIKSIDSLAKWLDGGNYIFFRGKSYHPGWARGFQFGFMLWNLEAGNVRKAVRI